VCVYVCVCVCVCVDRAGTINKAEEEEEEGIDINPL
jgi:hypothetical protein